MQKQSNKKDKKNAKSSQEAVSPKRSPRISKKTEAVKQKISSENFSEDDSDNENLLADRSENEEEQSSCDSPKASRKAFKSSTKIKPSEVHSTSDLSKQFKFDPLIMACISVAVILVPYLISAVCGCSLMSIFLSTPDKEILKTIDEIQWKFPKQEPILWKAIVSGINDTVQYKRPTSYILMYQTQAKNTIERLLNELSEYATCRFTDCKKKPIEIDTLKPIDYDYGSFLNHYRKDLENAGVMVVKNLEEMSDKYALAFHFICDEISPAVEKSAIFFTMKVDNFQASPLMDLRYIEKTLRQKWSNIEDDKFGPLFTRISAMPLRVHPEESKE